MDKEAIEADAQRTYEARRTVACSCSALRRSDARPRFQEKQQVRAETADLRTERNRLKRAKKKARGRPAAQQDVLSLAFL